MRSRRPPWGRAVGGSFLALLAVTGVVALLAPFAPNLSLGVIYLFAVLPVAALWGISYAIAVSLVSMASFVWLFLPRLHSFSVQGWQNWVAIATYLAAALLIAVLASDARKRALAATNREREAKLVAECASALLESTRVDDSLEAMSDWIARTLELRGVRVASDAEPRPAPGERWVELRAGRRVGVLYFEPDELVDEERLIRVATAIAALLAVALEREVLAEEALETEALRRADVAKTAVLHSVSHDLHSPLTAIRAAAEGLRNDSFALDAADRSLLVGSIVAETSRLQRLVRNLLDLSRLEASAAAPQLDVWALDEILDSALGATQRERVRVVLPPDVPVVHVDASQIERVLVNLIENALRFSPDDVPVEVAVDADEGGVRVTVKDRGPGIAIAESAWIFDPFRHGERGGSGLGLAIARGFAEVNGGTLALDDDSGRGASFTLTLPSARAAVLASEALV